MIHFPVTYTNGGDAVTIYKDGTKERRSVDASLAPVYPESIDIKITNYCDAGCAWCHEDSTLRGSDEICADAFERLSDMPAGSEAAIGGGNPVASKNLLKVHNFLHDRGVITNITVNHRHWKAFRNSGLFGLFYGVGCSIGADLPEERPIENVVLHFIAGIHDPELAYRALSHGWKILILGYKRWGRGAKTWSESIESNKSAWFRQLFRLANVAGATIAFDTLAVEQLKPERLFPDVADFENAYMGAEGTHSMYIDLVTGTYAKSSFDTVRHSFDSSLADAFLRIRQS